MGVKSKRVEYKFDDSAIRTLEEMGIDEPQVVFRPHLPPLSAPPIVLASPLLELMAELDREGWQWKLTSTLIAEERAYFARVWRSDSYGGSPKIQGRTRHEALAGAWEAAQTVRRSRHRNAQRRVAQAGGGRGS